MKDVEEWQDAYVATARSWPVASRPPALKRETAGVIQSYIQRIDRSFETLRQQLAEYDPDLLVIIGGDQSEMFDRSNVPNLMIYVGEEAWGHNVKRFQEPDESNSFRLRVDRDTSSWLLDRLVKREGFDVAFSHEFAPLVAQARGISHAFARPAPMIMPGADLPTVLIWENTYDAPSLPATRCYELGRALATIFKDDDRRIAILGSGGLSHGRSGWIDEPLDQWFLDQLATGNGSATTVMYTFDSETMRRGTGEMRAWITVAGAMEAVGSGAMVVDYIPAYHAVTGLGFAYWPTSTG
jgi:protocatechuate 4,5-dioxygenase beta chain